jgi:predicted transcriptional regulator
MQHNDKNRDLSNIVASLREKEGEIKKMNRANSDLSCKNMELLDRI